MSALPTPTQAAVTVPAGEAASCWGTSSAGIPSVMTKYLPVAGVHAGANIGDVVIAELRHCPGDHLRDDGRDAILIVGIDKPAIDARDDLIGLPARRPRFHGVTFSAQAGTRSITVKLASRKAGSAIWTPRCGAPLGSSMASRSTTSGASGR